MQRRNFMQKIALFLGVTGFAALPYGVARVLYPSVHRERNRNIPLPGALADQDAFVSACIGCGLCGEVCPPRCIKFHKLDGSQHANTPYIDASVKGCTLCGKCMDVCPTEALTKTKITDIDMGVAQIDRVACYPWVDKGICGACVAICPLGDKAIDFEFGNIYRPTVKDGCVGCGLCVEVCPEPSLPIRIAKRGKGFVARHGVGIRKQNL